MQRCQACLNTLSCFDRQLIQHNVAWGDVTLITFPPFGETPAALEIQYDSTVQSTEEPVAKNFDVFNSTKLSGGSTKWLKSRPTIPSNQQM